MVDLATQVIKPRLRGWLHAGVFPVVVLGVVVLVALAPDASARAATAVYGVSAALLFGISAAYHRGTWSPRVHGVLRRLDHANIFLVIAGTYTPFAVLLLGGRAGAVLLWTVWVGAALGVLMRVCWGTAPRWLSTPAYLALGWVALLYFEDILVTGGAAVATLLVLGGILYSLGGVVYALRRPDPSPRWFGFHEVFHAFTLAAFAVHYVAVSLVAHGVAS